MSKPSYKNQHKRIFDSVGTESSTLSSLKSNGQTGGGFLDYLFGTDPKSANMTCLIIESVKTNNIDALDFLLTRKFIPDLDYVDDDGNNILHALALASRKSSLALSSLFKIITGDINKNVLNQSL